jgi:flagellin-specific chaperone FliS
MITIETFTEEQNKQLNEAINKVTIELLKSLTYGQEIEITKHYTLYHYIEEDIIVLNLTEEWDEVMAVLFDGEEFEFEAL